jgi:hypothetical protein
VVKLVRPPFGIQAYRQVAVDVRWEERDGDSAAVLRAACSLKKGMVLCHEALLQGSTFESLLLDWGLSCLAALLKREFHSTCQHVSYAST